MTEEGQSDLLKIAAARGPPEKGGLSPFTVLSSSKTLSPIGKGQEEWVEIELCADTGACDNVMPKDCAVHIPISPSEASKNSVLYEVANKQTIPNLGERNLLMWPENSANPKRISMQVADVHKPLLSLSKCADMGFESRFGKWAGCLIGSLS